MELFAAGGAGELGQLAIGGGDDGLADGALLYPPELLGAVLEPQPNASGQAPVLAAQQGCYGQQPLAQAAFRYPHLPTTNKLHDRSSCQMVDSELSF